MKNNNKKQFLIGLAAYLVQSERSLHRSLNADWSEFISAYKNKYFISPQSVIKSIENKFSVRSEIDDFQNRLQLYVSSKRITKAILRLAFWIIKGSYDLTSLEASFIVTALIDFNRLLFAENEPTNEIKIAVRHELYSASLIIKDKFPSFSSINKRIESVEHFYQNDYLAFLNINEIVGNKWIE